MQGFLTDYESFMQVSSKADISSKVNNNLFINYYTYGKELNYTGFFGRENLDEYTISFYYYTGQSLAECELMIIDPVDQISMSGTSRRINYTMTSEEMGGAGYLKTVQEFISDEPPSTFKFTRIGLVPHSNQAAYKGALRELKLAKYGFRTVNGIPIPIELSITSKIILIVFITAAVITVFISIIRKKKKPLF